MASVLPVSDNGLSVAQRILNSFESVLKNMQDQGAPVWRNVYRGDLEDIDNTTVPAASIDIGTEEHSDSLNGCTTYSLPVFFHFRFTGQRGVDELDVYRYYIALLQMAVLTDHTLGGLTTNIEEDSNAHNIIGIEGVYTGGTLSTLVTYRTRLHNPYKLITELP